jgi:hypothetical protein
VVAENSWRFGSLTATSPARLSIPNRGGETVQIMGRAANVNDIECAAELSPVTRWQIEGDENSGRAVPPAPYFGVQAIPRGGGVELSGVSFVDLENTHAITSGTLTLYYWDELQGRPDTVLANGIGAHDTVISLSNSVEAGRYLQIDLEVMRVEEAQAGNTYRVTRAVQGTTPAAHNTGALAYTLASNSFVMPFPRDFFGSPYSGSWKYTIRMPDVRVATAEMFVTNAHGNGEARNIYLTHNDDCGLRTLSGGQYSIQVNGFLAVDESAAPAVIVETTHSVRDVFAVLGRAADAPVEVRLNVDDAPYCTLTFSPGAIVSDPPNVNGASLDPLREGQKLTMSVRSVGSVYPGADLTVLVRL